MYQILVLTFFIDLSYTSSLWFITWERDFQLLCLVKQQSSAFYCKIINLAGKQKYNVYHVFLCDICEESGWFRHIYTIGY